MTHSDCFIYGMDTRTVKKLLEMSEQEYLDFQQHYRPGQRNLHHMRIYQNRLNCVWRRPRSGARLVERHYPSFPNISIKSVTTRIVCSQQASAAKNLLTRDTAG